MQEEVKKIPYDELYFLRYTTKPSTTENVMKISLYQIELENRPANVEIINTTLLPVNSKNNVSEQNQVYIREGNRINLFRIYDIDAIHKLLQDSRATDPYTRQVFTAKDVKFVYPKIDDVLVFEDDETKPIVTMYLMYGILHSEGDEPALMQTETDGTQLSGEYYEKGVKKGSIGYRNGRPNKKRWINEYFELHRDGDKPAVCDWYENGNPNTQVWWKNGERHRDGDKPAACEWYENGNPRLQEWFKNGEVHRHGDKPAYYWWSKDGKINVRKWFKNGKKHRDGDKPAVCIWYENGNLDLQVWWKNGKRHRDGDKPTYCEWYGNGNLKWKQWWKNDKLHRDGDKPAHCEWYENGKIKLREWYKNGKRHRDGDKPAYCK